MSQLDGVDVAQLVSAKQWKSFVAAGTKFAIIRCYRNKPPGIVDDHCPATFNNALGAGVHDLDVYHYPYLPKSPEAQADEGVNHLRAHNLNPGRVWIDIETTDTPWKDVAWNLDFISRLVSRYEAHVSVGIYTSTDEWKHITGNSTAFSSRALWWSSHGKAYKPFGGWPAPLLIQTRYDQTLDGVDYDADTKVPALEATAAATRSSTTKKSVSPSILDGYLGKHIGEICGNGFASDEDNHCAHFVNHVMELDFPYSCKNETGGKKPAANLRVHETFARCGAVGKWPPTGGLTQCYAFVTEESAVNLAKKTMRNVPKKHIGIYCDTHVWHYSNAQKKVVKVKPEDFAKHYAGDGFAMFFGEFPALRRAWNTEITWPVAWGDMDANGHVNNAVFMRWLENSRVTWLEQARFPDDEVCGPVVASATINYRRAVDHERTRIIRIRVRAAEIGSTSLTLEYEVHDPTSDELLADASTRVSLISFDTGVPLAIPDDARERIHALDPGVTHRPSS